MAVQDLRLQPGRGWRRRGFALRQPEGGRCAEGTTNEAGMYKKRIGLTETCQIQRFTRAFRPRLKGESLPGCHPPAGGGPAARSRKDGVAPASGGREPLAGLAIGVWMAASRAKPFEAPLTSLPPPKRKTNPISCVESTKVRKNKPKTNPNKPSFRRGAVR